MAPEPKISVTPAEMSAARQQRIEALSTALHGLPTPTSAGVVPAHLTAVQALIGKTRGLLVETRRVNRVAQTAAARLGTNDRTNGENVGGTKQPKYGQPA